MVKLSISVQIECNRCRGTVFERPDDATDDPILICVKCGNTIGPESSINAALIGEAHTPLGGSVVRRIKNFD